MTTVAFLDAPAGCAGDMFLGALLDAGWPVERLRAVVAALGLAEVEVRVTSVHRGALAACKVDVLVAGEPAEGAPGHVHRGLADVTALIRAATSLPPEACADAVRVFRALAEAEARVHGSTPDEVHFHEVGAVDALVDVVGTCVGLRELGVTEVRAGPLPWGRGTTKSAHGILPLPPPAVALLLEGHPVVPSDATFEEVTPTGAALVRALARGTGVPVGFVPRRVGCGAGSRENPAGRLPNVVRLVVGEDGSDLTPTDALLLETNLDDATGQEIARVIDRALELGALDAWCAPITMKKGRPGFCLSLLVEPSGVEAFETLLFAETPTLGVRRRAVARTVLTRRNETVDTEFGPVRVKVREAPDGTAGTPEHDDCLRLARASGASLRRVIEAARAAFAARHAGG